MKTKTILFISAAAFLLTFLPAITNAQFKKGDLLVEGGLGNISVTNNKSQEESNSFVTDKYEDKGFSIAIFPRVGLFLSKNFVVGTTLGLNYSSDKFENIDPIHGNTRWDSKASSLVIDLMPFVRYYFPGNAKTRFYGQVDGGVSLSLAQKEKGNNYNNSGVVTSSYKTDFSKKYNSFSAEALVGLNHFVSQNVAVNCALGYKYSKGTQTSSTIYTPGGLILAPKKYTTTTGAFVWNVGFTMIIPGKKKK